MCFLRIPDTGGNFFGVKIVNAGTYKRENGDCRELRRKSRSRGRGRDWSTEEIDQVRQCQSQDVQFQKSIICRLVLMIKELRSITIDQ